MKQNAEIQYSIRLKDIFFPKVVLTAGEVLQKDVASEISVRLQYEISPIPTDKRIYQVVLTPLFSPPLISPEANLSKMNHRTMPKSNNAVLQ